MTEEEFKEKVQNIFSETENCMKFVFESLAQQFDEYNAESMHGAIAYWEEELENHSRKLILGMFQEISKQHNKFQFEKASQNRLNLGGSYDPKSE